jgi:hypothetical protein
MKNFLHKKNPIGIVLFSLLAIALVLIPAAGAEGMDITVPDLSAPAGSAIAVPVSVLNAEELAELDAEISYDPAVLKFSGIELMEVSQNGIVEATESRPGTIQVSVIDSTGISKDGELLKLSFDVIGAEGTSSPIGITSKGIRNLDMNDVPANLIGGKVSVTGAGLQTPLTGYVPLLAVGLAMLGFAWFRREMV